MGSMERMVAPGPPVDGSSTIDQEDTIHWKLAANGIFSLKSMYLHLIDSGSLPRSLDIWKIKVPLLKIFMWFVHKGVILTKDNFLIRNWISNNRPH